jgi:hypothetical protein
MNVSEGSDNEFWAEIEIVRAIQTDKQEKRDFESAATINFIDVIKKNISANGKHSRNQSPNKGAIGNEYYEDKIARIRESKDEEIKQFAIIIKNNLKREYENLVKSIKAKYKKDLTDIIKECVSLKEILQTKDIMITQLRQTIGDMQIYMTATRIAAAKTMYEPPTPPNELNEEFYLEQIYNLSTEVGMLKETCKMYCKEIDKAKERTKEVIEICKKNELNLKSDIEKLNEIIRQKDLQIEKQAIFFQNE